METAIRAMKRIGTTGNYLRVTDANEHLLKDNKMIEVTLVPGDDGESLVEEGSTSQDFLASKDLARIISEILTLDTKRASLLTHAARQIGGRKALKQAGIDIPEQTLEDTPAGRLAANNEKQNEKARQSKRQARAARKARKEQIDAANKIKNDAAKADLKPNTTAEGTVTRVTPTTPVNEPNPNTNGQSITAPTTPITDPANTEVEVELVTTDSDEDI